MAGGEREFDILLFGVTGWTGFHLFEYATKTYPPGSGIRWGVCGRNLEKLRVVKQRIAAENDGAEWVKDVKLVVADSSDFASLENAVKRTKSVATVVGPYAKYGEPLVKACVENKTHYVDITGEPNWIKEMIEKYHKKAEENGVFIIPSCGFDSIPSDLGTFMMVDAIKKKGKECQAVRAFMAGFAQNNRVGLSGPKPGAGTLLSLVGALENTPTREMKDPYQLVNVQAQPALIKYSSADKGHTPQMLPGYTKLLPKRRWTTHFLMALVNEKTVRRSASILKYSPQFSYHEALCMSNPVMAVLISLVMMILYTLLSFSFGRSIFRRIIPASSQLPPKLPSNYKAGMFEFLFAAQDQDGVVSHGRVFGPDEGGYVVTSLMLMESGLCLATELDRVKSACPLKGGVLTPAVMGHSLLQRLNARGMDFSVTD